VSERGDEAVELVRDLTDDLGAHSVLECVGTDQALSTAIGIVRPGGAVGRVGVPHYETTAAWETAFFSNVTISGGPAPSARISTNFSPTSSRAESRPGGSSTGSSASTKFPTATGR
jgi:Threonine dehydrogenase and related Zn-dependent dehydrogenases